MSNNQPPPGPYGSPQPGPYGTPPPVPGQGGGPNPYAQPVGGQPGYGFPQQQGPQGQQWGPPGPYDQTQFQPPSSGGRGRTVGIVIGAVAVAVAVVAGVLVFADGDGGGGGGGEETVVQRYKLTTPAVVADEYKADSGAAFSDGLDETDLAELEGYGVKGAQDVGQGYTSGTGLTAKQLGFAGVWGEIESPEAVLDLAFAGLAEAAAEDATTDGGGTAELKGSPEKQTPAGLGDAVMKCQTITFGAPPGSDAPVNSIDVPLCMWADTSTLGWVVSSDLGALATGQSPALSDGAELTAKVRNDTRVKVG